MLPDQLISRKLIFNYCCPAVTKFVNCCKGLSCVVWLYALFKSVIEKNCPLIRVSVICIGTIVQLRFVSPIIVYYEF